MDDLKADRIEFGGTIQSVQEHDGNYGVSYEFEGLFQGLIPETGETKASRSLFLPGVAEQLLLTIWQGSDGPVEFQLAIEPVPAEGSPTGYTWEVDTEVEGHFDDLTSLTQGLALEPGE